MRTLVRPFLLFAILCTVASVSQSQVQPPPPPPPPGGLNTFVWTKGFPAPTVGGVDVSVDIGPAPGWKCTEVTFRVTDAATFVVLGEHTEFNPGAVFAHSFGGMANNLPIRITAEGVFQNMGSFDVKQISTNDTTK
jgi:hypothetical protein